MIWQILQFVRNSRLARLIGTATAAVAAVLTFGQFKKREGVTQERAREAQEKAQANEEAHERITNADTGAGLSDDERVSRLRDFAAKHGNRPPQAGGR
jgi:hypothetical protein